MVFLRSTFLRSFVPSFLRMLLAALLRYSLVEWSVGRSVVVSQKLSFCRRRRLSVGRSVGRSLLHSSLLESSSFGVVAVLRRLPSLGFFLQQSGKAERVKLPCFARRSSFVRCFIASFRAPKSLRSSSLSVFVLTMSMSMSSSSSSARVEYYRKSLALDPRNNTHRTHTHTSSELQIERCSEERNDRANDRANERKNERTFPSFFFFFFDFDFAFVVGRQQLSFRKAKEAKERSRSCLSRGRAEKVTSKSVDRLRVGRGSSSCWGVAACVCVVLQADSL